LSFAKTYPAYITLGVLLLISGFLYYTVNNQTEKDLNTDYEKAVTSIMSRFDSQYQSSYNIVSSMSELYDIVLEVVRDYFDLYATVPVKTYSSILSVEYIEKVYDNDISIYSYFISTQGYSDYTFKAKDKKDVYYPIHHILPMEGNKHRHGLDMSSQPQFFSAAMKAVRLGKIVSSENYISRNKDTSSFFIIAPIYNKATARSNFQQRKDNLKGFLAIELDSKKFFLEALSGQNKDKKLSFPTDSLVYFKIVDINSDNEEKVIFESKNYNSVPTDFKPYKSSVVDFDVADRKLKVYFNSVPNFGGSIRKTLPISTLVVSLVLSFLFFAFVLSVTTGRARAVAIADKITESQRRIVEASRDIIGVFDSNGLWLSINPSVVDILKKTPDELLKTSILELSYDPTNQLNDFVNKINSAKSNFNDRITVKMKSGDGFKWMNWNLSYVKDDNLVYTTGRDITFEKLAEEDALLNTKQIKLAEMYALEASESKTYFMKKLSHQLRNSLTGILGYLQLLSNKLYDSESEMDQYVDFAEQSSEEIFTFVSDIVDATVQTSLKSNLNLQLVDAGKAFVDSFNQFKNVNGNSGCKLEISDNSTKAKAIADLNSLHNIYTESLQALSVNTHNIVITVEIQENLFEGATEIQILSSANSSVKELIKLYKQHSSDIISYLKYDKYDFLFKISNISSHVRRLNGSFSIEYLGDNDGNLISIQLPRNKQLD